MKPSRRPCDYPSAGVRSLTALLMLLISGFVAWPLAFAQTATVTTMSIAPGTSVPAGTVVTFIATVSASGTPISSGLVTFCDMETALYCEDGAVLGRVWLARNGTATLRTTLAYGGHNIKAVFQGTNSYATSSSDVQTISVIGTPKATTTTLSSVLYYGYGGLNQAQVTVRGAPIPALTGTASFIDATNANYLLTSLSLTAPTVTYTPFTSVGGVAVRKPEYTVTGDFNADGYLDFAVASNYANTVQVYLGFGDGTFSLVSTYASTTPVGLSTADFNGDGNLDIAVLNTNTISVYLSNGDGTFTLGSTPATGNYPYAFTVADVNGDGIPDFASTNNYTNKVELLLGVGDGTFIAGNSYPTGKYPQGIVAADFNGDGLVDLAAVNEMENTVTVLLGNGTGGFAAAPLLSLPATPYTLVAADFNGDGITDLAVSAIIQGAEIYLGNGNGTFGYKSAVTCGSSGNGYGLATADFNADGKTDLIVGKALFIGDGFGNFTLTANAGGSGLTISVGDFNGDGSPDLITPVYSAYSPYDGTVNISLEQATFTKLVSSIKVPGPGTHNVYASYSGDGGHAASQSNPAAMTGAQIATTNLLSVSPSTTVPSGTTVQLTATISPVSVGNYIPGGTVTFKEGTTVLGIGAVASGMAAITTNTLAVGPHTITAAYGGDVNFLSSNAKAVVVAITGGQITPTITWPTPAPIVYGTALSATQLNADSGGVAGTFIYTPSAGTVLPAGTQALSTIFTPTDTAGYTTATASVQLTVQKATPTVTSWPTAAAITYGQTLASATLSGGTASVPGAFAFTNPAFAPPAGNSAQSVTFTPTDTANYNPVPGTVNVTVNLSSQTITVTVPAPASAAYDTQFSVAATASSGLEVTYSSAGGCTNAGSTFTMTSSSVACTVKFDQAGDANYPPAAQVVQTVAASKSTPTVTAWPTAGSITYGQSLIVSTLSGGTASVPGSFAFNNPIIVLPVGTSSQSVTFTPSDTTNYNSVSGTVNVTVNPATLTVTANSVNRTYGASNPMFTASYSGFVNGDTAAVLSGKPSFTTTAIGTSTIGNYSITITVGGLAASNYSFVFVNGTLTITPAALTVTALNQTKTFGQTLILGTTAFTTTTLQNGESITAVTLTSTGATAAAGVAGSPYPITPSSATGVGFVASNYSINYVNGALIVGKATSTTTVIDPGNVKAGLPFTVRYSVAPQFTGTPTGTVTVTATDNNGVAVTSCSSGLTAGSGNCSMTINTKGFYTLTGLYSGDNNFSTSSGTAQHHAN